MGKFCHDCRQEYFENYNFKMFLKEGLKIVDIQKKILRTLVLVIFWPRKIIQDYNKGITIKYLNPIAFLFLVIGFGFLISGNEFLGQPRAYGSKFEEFVTFAIPALIASFIAGLIPYMKSSVLQTLVINLYLGAGLSCIAIILGIIDSLLWKHGVQTQYELSLEFILGYFAYYYFSIYGYHIHKMLTNILLFALIVLISFKYMRRTRVSTAGLTLKNAPTWIDNSSLMDNYGLNNYKLSTISKDEALIMDITGNQLRDALVIIENDSNNKALLAYHYFENEKKLFYFSELNLPNDSIVSFNQIPNTNNALISFKSEPPAVISWNGRIYTAHQP